MSGHRSRRDSRSPSPRRGRERSASPSSSKRLHLADLDETVSRRNVEDTFSKFGKLADVWVASYPPYYGFVVFENGEDAIDALKSMKSGYIGDCRIRVTVARPRRSPRSYRGGGGGGYGRRNDYQRRSRSPVHRRNDYPRRSRSPRGSRSPPPRKRDCSPRRSQSPPPRKRNYSPRRERSPVRRSRHSPIADNVSD